MTDKNTDSISYQPPYYAVEGRLWYSKETKNGSTQVCICNFTPRILKEICRDDGAEQSRVYRIGGRMENGTPLPETDVPAEKFGTGEWIDRYLPASCRLEVIGSAEKHVCCAVKGTAAAAERMYVFSHTGWKRIDGAYHFLLPGDERYEVKLEGKQRNYAGASGCTDADTAVLSELLFSEVIPNEVLYPCLALVFLSPLNEFLKQAGHEPKFLLTLLGHTGCMKSTTAALMLSFFGRFSSTDLPMTFRDTPYSILENAFALKDVLTCVDDYHPTSNSEAQSMKNTMQMLARGYGDRAARNRLAPDITLRTARPPQGNVIVTAEFQPDIGESGNARLFCIDMPQNRIDGERLQVLQDQAADGVFLRCMSGYLVWLKGTFLSSEEQGTAFSQMLGERFVLLRNRWRDRLREQLPDFHARLPDTLASLSVGFEMLLRFLRETMMLKADDEDIVSERFDSLLLALAKCQSCSVTEVRPSHVYLHALFTLIENDRCTLSGLHGTVPRTDAAGYEDDEFYYIRLEQSVGVVKKYCAETNQSFSLTPSALAKQLEEENILVLSANGSRTDKIRIGQKTVRCAKLRKEAVKKILEASL